MHLVIVHYHLLPGGVTSVITDTVRAIVDYGSVEAPATLLVENGEPNARRRSFSGIEGVTIAAGRGIDQYLHTHGAYATDQRLTVRHVPEFDYSTDRSDLAVSRTRSALDVLLRVNEPVLWVHNYHLGKNVALTRAILDLIRDRPELPVVLHVHDFPECGRLDNLRLLRAYLPGGFYPIGPSVRYAVINGRDYQFLTQSGIPPELVFRLRNPVHTGRQIDSKSRTAARSVRKLLATGTRRVITYPVRAIRRKNILEAGLVAKFFQDSFLVVTLPGISDSERSYSKFVEGAFEDGLITGRFSAGPLLTESNFSLADLFSASDALLSTSIEEGFGYQFINAVARRRPLIARELDVTIDIAPLLTGTSNALYSEIAIPARLPSVRVSVAELRTLYDTRLAAIEAEVAGDLSEVNRVALRDAVAQLFQNATLPYSFLTPQVQRDVLRDLADPSARADVSDANEGTIRRAHDALNSRPPDRTREIETDYGLASFCASVETILKSAATSMENAASVAADDVSRNLVQRFMIADRLRLLYLPFTGE